MNRFVLSMIFLLCGLSIWPAPTFMPIDIRIVYLIVLPILFLLSAILLRRSEHLGKFFQISFAFFIASFTFSLQYVVYYTPGSTVDGKVINLTLSMLLVVIPIVLITKISGNNMASIYLKKGNLRLGLIIGSVTFLIFLVTSIPAAIYLFGGNGANITTSNLISWTPWILAFVILNGLREELWFRGLFLRKYEPLLGADASNLLQALIFSLAHLVPSFTFFQITVFLTIFFFLGLAFGAVMQKTDSVLGSILFHAGTDIPVIIAAFSVL